jgi:hypothetical protein
MDGLQKAGLSVALIALVALLMYLRVRYPAPRRSSEVAVLAASGLAFFGICHALLRL